MKDELIKQIFQDNLKQPDNDDFNNRIIQELTKSKKCHRALFGEKSIVFWFLLTFIFICLYNVFIESKSDTSSILIGSVICLIPLSLIIFNKIYLIKNSQ